MVWKTTNYKGESVTWFSQETINRIREMATAGVIGYKYGAQNEYHSCEDILEFLNEKEKIELHKCKDHLVFDHTVDTVLPFGDIDSSAVFKCEICGKEFNEEDLEK